MRFSTPYRSKEKKVEIENKSVACAGNILRDRLTMEERAKISGADGLNAPVPCNRSSLIFPGHNKKGITSLKKGESHQLRISNYAT